MEKLQKGVWQGKGFNLMYILIERKDGDYDARCVASGRTHLIKKDDCKNFLDNHYKM